jgi:hypothetical protein
VSRRLGVVLLALTALGCSQVTAALPPWLRPPPATTPTPRPSTPPDPAPPALPALLPPPALPAPVPPPAAPAPVPPPAAPADRPPDPTPAPVVSPRIQDEDRVSREVSERLAEAKRLVARIDPARLAGDQRDIFTSIQDFLVKADEALQARDLPRARILADKASKLAGDLAAALNRK